MLDVLLYLFEHFFYEDPDAVRGDRDSLQTGLIQAGFSPSEIHRAFDWLDALAQSRPVADTAPGRATPGPLRLYADVELARLDCECRGFLLLLEQNGVLDAARRELVLDRALALDGEIDLDDLKWVVLMVLFNQPGQEAAFAWMESHMFDEPGDSVH